MSTDILMQDLQSEALETNELESQKNHMHMNVLGFSANPVSNGSKKIFFDFFENNSKYKNCRLTSWRNAAVCKR